MEKKRPYRPRNMSLEEIVDWDRSLRISGPNGCRYSTAAQRGGYPSIGFEGKLYTVAQLEMLLKEGPSNGRHVLHDEVCAGRRDCCAQEHLRYGTNAENMKDKARLGRSTRKLTDEEILEIQDLYVRGDCTQAILAELYGVSRPTISQYTGRNPSTRLR